MKNKIKNWENEYMSGTTSDCPYCSRDKPDHSCQNCYSEMSKDTCWELEGYCSKKCQKYITEELPRIRQKKVEAGIKCRCDNPQCAKCLGTNGCKDEGCPTHPSKKKEEFKMRYKNNSEE